jgi:hypothetical protein
MQLGHEQLSVFGVGAELNDKQWRAVIRQLVAMGHLQSDSEGFGGFKLTETSRGVLRGETPVMLREEAERVRVRRTKEQKGTCRIQRRRGRGREQRPRLCLVQRLAQLAHCHCARAQRAGLRDPPRRDAGRHRHSAPAQPGSASLHPRHRRQEAGALRRRADRDRAGGYERLRVRLAGTSCQELNTFDGCGSGAAVRLLPHVLCSRRGRQPPLTTSAVPNSCNGPAAILPLANCPAAGPPAAAGRGSPGRVAKSQTSRRGCVSGAAIRLLPQFLIIRLGHR